MRAGTLVLRKRTTLLPSPPRKIAYRESGTKEDLGNTRQATLMAYGAMLAALMQNAGRTFRLSKIPQKGFSTVHPGKRLYFWVKFAFPAAAIRNPVVTRPVQGTRA